MTLIAAFRCDDGVVICADSKESYLDFYTQVDKIGRLDLGAYEGVIGGSGNEGTLIDGLTDVLSDEIKGWPGGLKESAMKVNLRRILRDYYANEVKHHPASRKAKYMEFVICVKDKGSENIHLWKTESTALKPIDRFALIGFNTGVYEYETARLYGGRGRPWVTRAVALGVHLLALAKSTCLWVGGPSRVVVGKYNGLRPYDLEDVEVLEERARKFSEALAELTLALPDVSTSEGSFIEVLGGFEERVLALRGYYIRRLARSLAERVGTGRGETTLKGELPVGASIPIGHGLVLEVMDGGIGISDGYPTIPLLDSEKSEGQP